MTDSGRALEAYVAPTDDDLVQAVNVVVLPSEEAVDAEEQRKLKKIAVCGCIALVIILVAAVVVPVSTKLVMDPEKSQADFTTAEPSETAPPVITEAPTTERFNDFVENVLIPISDDPEVFENKLSPQYRAAVWAADEDLMMLPLDSGQILQRYALATFYYATNGDDWQDSTGWLSQASECTWLKLNCSNTVDIDRILFKQGNNLVGTLPFELSLLTAMNMFYLPYNKLRGPFPDYLESWTNLHTFIVAQNELEGSLPAFPYSIESIRVYRNKLTGEIPTSLASLPVLDDVQLYENQFSGNIPSELGLIQTLDTLRLQVNQLEGEIPTEIFKLSNLKKFRVDENPLLTGSLSTLVGQLTKLYELGLNATGMGGPLPETLFALTDMKYMYLNDAHFNGTLSEKFSSLAHLKRLFLQNNSFGGPVPSDSFASLTNLKILKLHNNDLTGVIGQELCNRTTEHDGLHSLTADCGGDSPEVECDCCHECYPLA